MADGTDLGLGSNDGTTREARDFTGHVLERGARVDGGRYVGEREGVRWIAYRDADFAPMCAAFDEGRPRDAASGGRTILAMLIECVLVSLGLATGTLPIAELCKRLGVQMHFVSHETLVGEAFLIDVDEGVVIHLEEGLREFAWHGVAEALGYAVLSKLGLHAGLLDRAAAERCPAFTFEGVAELRALANRIGEELLVPDAIIAKTLGTPRKLVYCVTPDVMSDDDRWFNDRVDEIIASLRYEVLKDIAYERAVNWLTRALGESPWVPDREAEADDASSSSTSTVQ